MLLSDASLERAKKNRDRLKKKLNIKDPKKKEDNTLGSKYVESRAKKAETDKNAAGDIKMARRLAREKKRQRKAGKDKK